MEAALFNPHLSEQKCSLIYLWDLLRLLKLKFRSYYPILYCVHISSDLYRDISMASWNRKIDRNLSLVYKYLKGVSIREKQNLFNQDITEMDKSCYKNVEVVEKSRSEKIEVDLGEKYSCLWDLFLK